MYDLVIKNGRVIDPESRFDKVTNLGIISGKIQLISDEEILGEKEFDASSLVVAPGAIVKIKKIIAFKLMMVSPQL